MIHFDPFAWIYEKNRQHDPARNRSRDRIDYRNIRYPRRRVSGANPMMNESYVVDLEKTLVRLKAEIRQLKSELETCKQVIDALNTPDSQATIEVKRLREELRNNGILR